MSYYKQGMTREQGDLVTQIIYQCRFRGTLGSVAAVAKEKEAIKALQQYMVKVNKRLEKLTGEPEPEKIDTRANRLSREARNKR